MITLVCFFLFSPEFLLFCLTGDQERPLRTLFILVKYVEIVFIYIFTKILKLRSGFMLTFIFMMRSLTTVKILTNL